MSAHSGTAPIWREAFFLCHVSGEVAELIREPHRRRTRELSRPWNRSHFLAAYIKDEAELP